jgi:glycopeptide antibiotics resistance protein
LETGSSAARPGKSTARLLWMLFASFVVYGTTFPFSFSVGGNMDSLLLRINWRPLGGVAGNLLVSDIIQNILLFIPFGFLGYFSLIHKSSWLKKSAIVAMGAMLSASVEFLQIFSPLRSPALSDIIFNTLGTALGLGCGILLKKSVLGFKSHPVARRFLDAPSAYPAFILLLLTVMGCWEPFDFSLDVGVVWAHVKPLLHGAFVFAKPDDDLVSFIRFMLSGLFTCRVLQETGFRRPALVGAAAVACLGVGLEATQVFIQSRFPEVQDVAVAVAGALAGAIVFFFPGFHLRPKAWFWAGAAAIFLSAAAAGLYPYRFTSHRSDFNWVLFLPQYERTTFASLGDFIEGAMTYFPLGFLLGYFRARPRASIWAAALAGIMALAIEGAQGFVVGRFSDVTEVLGAMLGGLAGSLAVTRGWPAFREYMRRDDDRQV